MRMLIRVREDAIIPLGAMPLDAMAAGGPDYSATPSDLRIQKNATTMEHQSVIHPSQ
jgi:hypothetical protein